MPIQLYCCLYCLYRLYCSLALLQADGHCLYRSLEDQLEVTAAAAAAAAEGTENGSDEAAQVLNYQELRELAAEHIRQHKCVVAGRKCGHVSAVWFAWRFLDCMMSYCCNTCRTCIFAPAAVGTAALQCAGAIQQLVCSLCCSACTSCSWYMYSMEALLPRCLQVLNAYMRGLQAFLFSALV